MAAPGQQPGGQAGRAGRRGGGEEGKEVNRAEGHAAAAAATAAAAAARVQQGCLRGVQAGNWGAHLSSAHRAQSSVAGGGAGGGMHSGGGGVPCQQQQSPTRPPAASTRWRAAKEQSVPAALQEPSSAIPRLNSRLSTHTLLYLCGGIGPSQLLRRRGCVPLQQQRAEQRRWSTRLVSTLALVPPARCTAIAVPRSASPPGPDAAAPRPACSGAA